jgi:hypothetical protein
MFDPIYVAHVSLPRVARFSLVCAKASEIKYFESLPRAKKASCDFICLSRGIGRSMRESERSTFVEAYHLLRKEAVPFHAFSTFCDHRYYQYRRYAHVDDDERETLFASIHWS